MILLYFIDKIQVEAGWTELVVSSYSQVQLPMFQAVKCNMINQIGVEERIIKDDSKQGEQKFFVLL